MKLWLILIFIFPLTGWSKTILFLGDSLTEGYRLAKEEAYPHLIEQELKKKHPDIKVINGGLSGATTASGPKRVDWYLKAKPDIMVLALGANDGLRGLRVSETAKNLSAVIEKAKARGITVILGGMKMPPNYGQTYRKEFDDMFPALAKKHGIKLIPFILEGVGGEPKYNLPDGIHPNPEGHKIMAKNVIKYLEEIL